MIETSGGPPSSFKQAVEKFFDGMTSKEFADMLNSVSPPLVVHCPPIALLDENRKEIVAGHFDVQQKKYPHYINGAVNGTSRVVLREYPISLPS